MIPSKIYKTSFVGVLLNIFLAYTLFPFASDQQIKPPNGAASLPLFSQFMHMIVHHKQVLFMSSLIVFVIVFISRIMEYMNYPVLTQVEEYFKGKQNKKLTFGGGEGMKPK